MPRRAKAAPQQRIEHAHVSHGVIIFPAVRDGRRASSREPSGGRPFTWTQGCRVFLRFVDRHSEALHTYYVRGTTMESRLTRLRTPRRVGAVGLDDHGRQGSSDLACFQASMHAAVHKGNGGTHGFEEEASHTLPNRRFRSSEFKRIEVAAAQYPRRATCGPSPEPSQAAGSAGPPSSPPSEPFREPTLVRPRRNLRGVGSLHNRSATHPSWSVHAH